MVFVAQGAQVLALFPLLIRVKARLLELVVRDGVFHAVHDELDALLNLCNLLGKRGLPQLHARACLVDQVDFLISHEDVGDVSV